jgi:hypothetical protein
VDAFFVLEGAVEFVAAAPGARHGFRPESRIRLLNIRAPDAGFAEMLRR